jgi:hypothetical protein
MKHATVTKRIPIREEQGSYREPTLAEIMSDSIVEAVMRADDVDADELHRMLGQIAGALRTRSPVRPASIGEMAPARAASRSCFRWPSQALCRS